MVYWELVVCLMLCRHKEIDWIMHFFISNVLFKIFLIQQSIVILRFHIILLTEIWTGNLYAIFQDNCIIYMQIYKIHLFQVEKEFVLSWAKNHITKYKAFKFHNLILFCCYKAVQLVTKLHSQFRVFRKFWFTVWDYDRFPTCYPNPSWF